MAKKSAEKNARKKTSGRYKKRGESQVKGKKDKYHRLIEPKLKLVLAMKRRGVSDEDIASSFGVAYSTFREYKKKYPPLSAVLSAGAHEAVLCVENALFEKSVGMDCEKRVPMKVKEVIYDERTGRKVKEIERIEYVKEQVLIPPDVGAMKFFLINRAPDAWAEHKEPTKDVPVGGLVMMPARLDEKGGSDE